MFHFIRNPRPQETLYSLAARTRLAITWSSAVVFVRALFGLSHLSLGLGLANFRQVFEHDARLCQPLGLITSFVLPIKKRENAIAAVLEGRAASAAYLLGAAGRRRLVGNELRYCPVCVQEQRAKYREAHWTLLPQIVGVECCPEHKVNLASTGISRRNPGGLFSLEEALADQINVAPVTPANQVNVELAGMMEKLLTFEPTWDSAGINRSWKGLLATVELGKKRRGSAKRLQRGLVDRFGEAYLNAAGCVVSPVPECSWVARFLRNPSKEGDPLRHLLILSWLGKDLADLSAGASFSPFGDGGIDQVSVKCRNLLCPDHGKNSIRQTRIFRKGRDRADAAQFTCGTCGSITERFLGADESTDRIIDRGELWRNELSTGWANPALSLRRLSRDLAADPMTVKREAVKLSLAFPRYSVRATRMKPSVGRLPLDVEGLGRPRRALWLTAVKAAKGTKPARTSQPAAYAWLYRWDRDWLRDNCPERQPVKPTSHVDWKEREATFITRLPDAWMRIVNREPSVRCSLTALARELRAERHLKYLDRMPKLQEELAYLIEDEGRFALRRIASIAETHIGSLTFDQLRRKAGIRHDVARNASVAEYIREQLKKVRT